MVLQNFGQIWIIGIQGDHDTGAVGLSGTSLMAQRFLCETKDFPQRRNDKRQQSWYGDVPQSLGKAKLST